MKRSALKQRRDPALAEDRKDFSILTKAVDTPTHHDLVAHRAYEIWEERGRPEGCDWENWILAEWQILGELLAYASQSDQS